MVAGPSFVRCRGARPALVGLAVALGACRGDTTSPPSPRTLDLGTAPPTQAVVASTLAVTPTFVVRDDQGLPLAGVPVSITIVDGGGSLANAPTITSGGATSIGAWTLGERAGRNALRIMAGNLPPVELEVRGIPDRPTALDVIQGDDQSAEAGGLVTNVLAVRVVDRFGNGVANVTVAFSVTSGGGEITPGATTSGADGIAAGAAWRLGRFGGTQSVVATAGALTTTFKASIRSDYSPVVRFFGPPPSGEVQSAFTKAVARIHASVVSDLADIPLLGFDMSRCGVPGVTLNEAVDDVLIYATVTTIDGPGNILASAGPCVTRSQSHYVVVGIMRFDVDDLNDLAANGSLDAVILHELLHMVGFGTLWRDKGLVLASGTADPRFGGLLADAHCIGLEGAWACGSGTVPIESVGGSGTIESHWRESVFHSELMTGYAEPDGNMPMSAITLGSLEDLGLEVNYLAADAYLVPPPDLAAAPGATQPAVTPWEVFEPPRFDVTPGGWIRPVSPP